MESSAARCPTARRDTGSGGTHAVPILGGTHAVPAPERGETAAKARATSKPLLLD